MTTNERLLTSGQLAEVLGFSPGTVVDWAEAGKLPAFKLGGRLRFRLGEIEAWLEDQRLSWPGGGGETPVTPLHPAGSSMSLASHSKIEEERDA